MIVIGRENGMIRNSINYLYVNGIASDRIEVTELPAKAIQLTEENKTHILDLVQAIDKQVTYKILKVNTTIEEIKAE